jgi:uncharacterized protein (DUF427 family)
MKQSKDSDPRHYALTAACSDVCRLFLGDELLLQCDRVVVLREVNAGREYPEVIYFPGDVVQALNLVKTDKSSFCPIKGYASYWSFRGLENCIWSYLDPLPGVFQIRQHYAFDTSQGLRISRQG